MRPCFISMKDNFALSFFTACFFLKYLDSMENRRKLAAEIQGKSYSYIIDEEYRWETWAAPKKDGKIDYNVAMTGDDLQDFVNRDLFPYLGGFSQRATSPDTIVGIRS